MVVADSISIVAAVAPKLGFASHQNAVPVLRELEVINGSDTDVEGLELIIEADPAFLEPKRWLLDRLGARSTLHINDRHLKLSGSYLGELTESLRGEVRFRVARAGETIATREFPVELLARAEWGGAATMAELLPAFVMPNDPAIDTLLKATSDVLRRAGKPDGIDGYTSESRQRVWQLASAMWSAVAGKRISYALPPASFEVEGQKVRTPSAILESRVGTCLDTALLFAAVMEQAGLNPLLILTEGHAFVGVWLQPQEFSTLLTDDAASLRKRVALKELLVFETTLVTQAPVPSFAQAIEHGRRQIAEEVEDGFVVAIDVHRARMQRIRPLAVAAGGRVAGAAVEETEVIEPLLEAPPLPAFDVELEEEARTPADRVMLWQRKLLDLTTRNRLLHLPENARAVTLHCPDPAHLEDRLAEGRKVRIRAFPDLATGGRDAELFRQQTSEDLRNSYAAQALERGEVVSPMDPKKLESSLIDLYRKAKSDLEEGGANTLFLALGFLKWKKNPDDIRQFRAPLILLPLKLERKSAISGVSLAAHEAEPRFNLTLLELLRHDFELTIPGLDGTLPGDESGVDVRGVWTTVQRAVRDLPGFEVVEDVVIGTFSFAKYLMWKDLVDRADLLKESPIVRHLIERGSEPFESSATFPAPAELDERVDPAEIFAPLPADSSQLAAIVASGKGCDFVLDGPPGTGKSQTIANMIAHNLALGRRVLFVAEKRAALEVVYRRLAQHGLGEFCLELHSNKTAKLDVLKQLGRAWDVRESLSEEGWRQEAAAVRELRDRLNAVVRLLHARHPGGLTIHGAIGRVVLDADDGTPRLHWPVATVHDAEQLEEMRDLARRLGIAGSAVARLPEEFSNLQATHWTNGWQDLLVAAARELTERLDAAGSARDRLLEVLQLQLTVTDLVGMQALEDIAVAVLATHGRDYAIAFSPEFPRKAEAGRRAAELAAEYRREEEALSCRYAPEAARRLDLSYYAAELERADARFWLLATWARKRLARRFGEEGGAAGLPDIRGDLPKLQRLKQILGELDNLAPAVSGVPGWSGCGSDPGTLSGAIDVAERLRGRMTALASTPDELVELRRRISTLVVEANELLGSEGAVGLAHGRFAVELPRMREASERLARLAEAAGLEERLSIHELRELAVAILGNAPALKAWCDWQRIRGEAAAAGLQPIAEAVESGTAAPSAEDLFETAYARWFAAGAIDAEPRLAELITDVHADDIEAYRRLEDRLASLSVRYIRARISGQIPDRNEVSRRDGYGVLKHQLQLQRRHKPVRQLAVEMGEAFTALAPCMLMSPLSIAQYLPPDQALFDLVIFDEASQIAPWDAIGSIARGRQVVIAGDPRQMPPTSFFSRAAGSNEDDDSTEADMESILDECLGAGVPRHGLEWHYRSRHESLIAFSNSRYYENALITFPAPERRESAVSWRRLEGVYAKGRGRTNMIEARAMVHEVVSRLTDPAFVAAGRTLAIVTLNADQQRLVEDLLDEARRRDPRIEPFFGEELTEPVVVKNLETVQGDERDVILLGIGYGPTEPGARTMSMSFGPLNRDGGWRRLNVAATRARQEMILFTSFDAGMIDLNRTSARAVRDLKHFIEFADRGPRALAEAIQGSVGAHESPFEQAVAAALTRKGWTVVPQIGVSRFRIDLGVVHPDRPGDYLLGVECDGATYHSAATARDRDKVRAAILENLGWRLLRVWSTDWWVDREGAAERLHRAIERVLEENRTAARAADKSRSDRELAGRDARSPEGLTDERAVGPTRLGGEALEMGSAARTAPFNGRFQAMAGGGDPPPGRRSVYRTTDFASLSELIDPASFYEPSYRATLLQLICHVVEQEGPISVGLLVERIARAHGFQRAGRVIREAVLEVAGRNLHMSDREDGAAFVWADEATARNWCFYRLPERQEDIRSIEHIAREELRAAAVDCHSEDREVEIARLFGIRRVSPSARERITRALTGSAGGAEQNPAVMRRVPEP